MRGQTWVKGRIVGYRPEYGVKLNLREPSWFFMSPFGKALKVEEDGTFRHELELLFPNCAATLRLNRYSMELFLVPGGELEVTINLPVAFWSQSHLLSNKKEVEERSPVCFDGDYAGLNAELQRVKHLMKLTGTETFYTDICGMAPSTFKKYLFRHQEEAKQALQKDKKLSDACRTYVQANLDANLFCQLANYKGTLSFAPMLAGKGKVDRADMTVDSASYFKEILELDILRSPYLRYYQYYADVARYAGRLVGSGFPKDPLWEDVLRGKCASRNLSKNLPMSDAERSTLDSVSSPEIKKLFLHQNDKVTAYLNAADEAVKEKTDCIVRTVGKEVAADSLLQIITQPYRGRVVLVDMWNTWCGPCMRAMKSIKPLKEELKEVVYLYIANETSSEVDWKRAITSIPGIHYRITNEQSNALGKLYEYTAIPTYLVVNREGEISYQVTGFPGVEKLKEELTK